ncbi:hypothetical protein [Candidatus Phytoplasma oryzae]|nr:hypothetical protein PIE28_00445 [Candidatus Phytoplasma oryzae]
MKIKKKQKINKIKSAIYILSILSVAIILAYTIYAASSYFYVEQPFQKNYKIGIVSSDLLKSKCIHENDSNQKELVALNIPFIDTDIQTHNIEEIHQVKLDQDQLKNKLKTTRDNGYDILKNYKHLNVDYKVALVAKNNKKEDNVTIINSQDGIDIKTQIFDKDSQTSQESTIAPVEISYKKSSDPTSSIYTDYVDTSGNLKRPEVFIPRKSNEIFTSTEKKRLENLKNTNEKQKEKDEIIKELELKQKQNSIDTKETNRLNNLKNSDTNTIEQEIKDIISELEKKQKECQDEYISYDIKVKFYINTTLNKDFLESFFADYNKNNPNNTIKYTDFALNDNDTPKLNITLCYKLVNDKGDSLVNNFTTNNGKTGMSQSFPENKLKNKNKLEIKIINSSASKNRQKI